MTKISLTHCLSYAFTIGIVYQSLQVIKVLLNMSLIFKIHLYWFTLIRNSLVVGVIDVERNHVFELYIETQNLFDSMCNKFY